MRTILLLAGLLVGHAHGLQAATNAPTLADYQATYERERDKIRTNNAAVLAADGDYWKTLDSLAADFKKQGDFENTVALAAERKRFEATRMVPDQPPTNTTAAIVKAQADYRAALARAEVERAKQTVKLNTSYVKALKALIKTYLADDKMAEAEAANKEMKLAEAALKKAADTLAIAPAGDAPAPSAGAEDADSSGVSAAGTTLPANMRMGLVLYYNFDKDEGGKVSDASAKHNNGTVHGATWTSQGRIGGAYDFNGRDAYISGPNVISGFRTFSFLAWVRIRAITHESYMGIWGQQALDHGDHSYAFYTAPGSHGFGSDAGGEDDGPDMDTRTTHPLSLNEWHLIAQTYDGTEVKQYDNGTLINAARIPGKSLGNKQNFAIGRVVAYPGHPLISYFDGQIDEVMVFKRALTEAEIKQLYNLPK